MGKIVISTTISQEDWDFCKKNNLKWTKLLENAISITRKAFEQGEESDAINFYKNRLDRQNKRVNSLAEFLNDKGLYDEFLSLEEKEKEEKEK